MDNKSMRYTYEKENHKISSNFSWLTIPIMKLLVPEIKSKAKFQF